MGTARVRAQRAVATLTVFLAVQSSAVRAETCRPAQTVTPEIESGLPAVVSVYWDISGSMSFSAPVTQEVVATLDSSILQRARVREIRHYTIGNEVREVTSARAVAVERGQNTSLHKVAEQVGGELARREVGASIIVSDLDLDIPAGERGHRFACPDVPMPANSRAGAVFGRCFVSGLAAGRTTTVPDLFVHVFGLSRAEPKSQPSKSEKAPPARFFVLVIARDIRLGRSVASLMKERWSALAPQSQLLFDSRVPTDSIAAPTACSWTDKSLYEVVRSRNTGGRDECHFLCTDTDGRARLMAPVKGSGSMGGLLKLTATGATGNGLRATMSGANLTMELDCPKRARKTYETLSATIGFAWELQPSRTMIVEGNARELVQSLLEILPDVVQKRSVTMTIKQR